MNAVVDVRGALGTQLLMYAAHCFHGKPGKVRLNVGGDIAGHVKVDYLSQMLAFPPPIEKVGGTAKLDLGAPGVLEKAFCAIRRKNNQALEFVDHRDIKGDTQVIHVRTGDRQCVRSESYLRLMVTMRSGFTVLGNGSHDPVRDWFYVMKSEVVYSSVSLFTVSAAIVNPNMQLMILPPDGKEPPPAFLKRLDELQLPNVKWIHI